MDTRKRNGSASLAHLHSRGELSPLTRMANAHGARPRTLRQACVLLSWLLATLALGFPSGRNPLVPVAILAAVAAFIAWLGAARWSSPLLAAGLLVLSLGLLAPKSVQALGEGCV